MTPLPIQDNILTSIGNTPLVRLKNCVPSGPHQFFAKVESLNPGGSIKDRMALHIIEQAEKRQDLKPGGTIVEATSGNTGIGLAMVAAVKGYKCIFTIPSKMSKEKVDTLRAFGAEVIVTPSGVAAEDPQSHYSVAKELCRKNKTYFLANQYDNPDNPKAHFETTGPEIWEQMNGDIDIFVDGAGTGGTLTGTGRYLKSKNPNVKIVCADPIGSILFDLYYQGKVVSPPKPYLVEGIGEDMLPKNVDLKLMDAFVQVEDKDVFQLTRKILRRDGIFVGPSCGASLAAALQYTKNIETPQRVVVIFPDSGSKYLSKVYNDEWMKTNGLLEDQ